MNAPVTTKSNIALSDPSLLIQQALVGGQWVDSASKKTLPVTNPANGATLAYVPDMDADDARAAIAAAKRAMPAWAALSGKQRSQALRKWFDLIVANGEDLARLVTAEQGKPLAEARAELAYAASFIEWFAEEAKRVAGEMPAAPTSDRRILVLRQPIGVCAAITPWNFPLAMITRKAGAALAAGCPMVVKPARETPLSALALGELALRAGIPMGILSFVTSSKSSAIGAEFCSNPTVRKLSFTGSTEVGRILLRQCADTVKKCSMELGGNAPVLVFADCDLDVAIAGVMNAKFRNAGQSCIAANRIFVADEIYDVFAERLGAAIAKLSIGAGTEDGVVIGPLIDEGAVGKVESHVADAVRCGATLKVGGRRHALGRTFFEPTLITEATRDMLLFRDETFGPITGLFRFRSDEEAIELANDSPFGLAAYLFTKDLARAILVSEALEYGIVGLNEGLISNEVAPFGGMKESGLGREGSIHGIHEYLEMKYICIGGLTR